MQLIDVFSQQPDEVWVLKDGSEVQISIDHVKPPCQLTANSIMLLEILA